MSENIREWITEGKRYYSQRDFDRAEPFLRRVAQQQPNYADVQNMLGVIYHSAGRFSDAIKGFERALAINPNYTEALLNLAVLYNDLGQYKDAKRLYAHLQKGGGQRKGRTEIEPVLKSKLSNMHADIGDIYYGLGRYDQAMHEYQLALDLNPDYVDILTKFGVAQRERGDSVESIATLRKAIKLKPKFHHARIQLGVSLYASGKTAEAKKTWQAVLHDNPGHGTAKMYLSLCETKQ